jgi:hypothetical protein
VTHDIADLHIGLLFRPRPRAVFAGFRGDVLEMPRKSAGCVRTP